MTATANQIITQAKKWLGLRESTGSHKVIIDTYNSHKPRARGYKLKYTDAWCAGYVSAVAIACKATDIIPTEVSCPKMIDLCKKKGIFIENENRVPALGDIVFYDWQDNGKGDNKGASDHVGICISVDTKNKTFEVIEGNYNNKVGIRELKINGKYLRGFAVPKYSKVSAAKKSNAEIAKEVIKGKWGNGSARKKKLEKAGYNYSEIQKIVNTYYK